MGYETAGNPREVARFAGTVLGAANGLSDSLDAAQHGMTLSASDFGNSDGASAASDTAQNLVDAATGATSRLQTVLTNDVDGLYQVAFAIQTTDEANTNTLPVVE